MAPIHNYIKLEHLGYTVYIDDGVNIFGKLWRSFMFHDWVDKSVI